MRPLSPAKMEDMWARHQARWRDTAQVSSQWEEANAVSPATLRFTARGEFFDILSDLNITLFVTREYEHLLFSLSAVEGRPLVSYFCLPHPSGIAVDRKRSLLWVASTRNPNQLFEFAPVTSFLERLDVRVESPSWPLLLPRSSRFLPGSYYLHDLALIGDELHGNAVGHNTVVSLESLRPVWWPRSVEQRRGDKLDSRVNYLQLNSIAAGRSLEDSFFSASAAEPSHRRPGQRNFPVDGRGVIFSGRTREVIATGLTRPHSARLYRGDLWVDNSGYGELGRIVGDRFQPVLRLPGWTRGLCFVKHYAFVGVSRVIPRFRQYAPGLDVAKSTCGVHVIDMRAGDVKGSLTWPHGNQIFGIDWFSGVCGFPFSLPRRSRSRETALFYAFQSGER